MGSNSFVHGSEDYYTLVPECLMSTLLRAAHFSTNSLLSQIWALGPRRSWLSLWFFSQFKMTEMTWCLGHEEWCFSIRRIMVCAQQSEKWFGAVLPVLLDLRAVSPTIIYGLYDIVSGASHPQIDLGSSWKATSSGEKMFNWFIWRRKQVLKAMRKHELFDHVIVVEESHLG